MINKSPKRLIKIGFLSCRGLISCRQNKIMQTLRKGGKLASCYTGSQLLRFRFQGRSPRHHNREQLPEAPGSCTEEQEGVPQWARSRGSLSAQKTHKLKAWWTQLSWICRMQGRRTRIQTCEAIKTLVITQTLSPPFTTLFKTPSTSIPISLSLFRAVACSAWGLMIRHLRPRRMSHSEYRKKIINLDNLIDVKLQVPTSTLERMVLNHKQWLWIL